VEEVRADFKKWKKVLDQPGVDVASIEKINQDFARKYPNVITDIKLNTGWEQVVHGDLFNYLENVAQKATHIRAFREIFPQTTEGRKSMAELVDTMRDELGPSYQKDLDALLRTLQGSPVDNYSSWGMLSPTEPVGRAFKMANQTVGNFMAKSVLTGQMFVQPGETVIGATPVFFGYKNYLRGLAKVKQIYGEMEQSGSVNRVMHDFSYDPNSPIRSSFNMAGNTLSKAFATQALNELQEAAAAATAHVVARRIEAGTLTPWEQRMLPETFRTMGFNQSEVASIMLADPQMLAQMERKAAPFLTGGAKAVSESSWLGANRLFNSVFRFQSYPMMKTQQFRRVTSRMTEAWSEGTPEQKRAATEQFARFMFGGTMQGILTVAITTLFYKGLPGLVSKWQEAQDEPLEFLMDMFGATMAGPLYLLARGGGGKGLAGFGENATRMIFPWTITKEIWDMVSGHGPYRDLDTFDKIGKFISSKTPGTKAIGTGMAMAGLSMEDKNLEASLSAFNRWNRDVRGFVEVRDYRKDDERKKFRIAMGKALVAMKRGDADAFREILAMAAAEAVELGVNPAADISEWFKRKQVLQDLEPDELESLKERIGDSAYERLQFYDMMLESAAEGVPAPRYSDY
jgi:hypothetical protein